MIRTLKYLFLFLCCVLLQTSLTSWIRIFDVAPDFILIFVVVAALRQGPVVGMLWGFFAGFSQDVYAPVEWLGSQTLSLTIVGFIIGQFEERFLTLNLPLKVCLLGFGFLIADILYYVSIGVDRGNFPVLLVTKTLPECLYTMLCGTLIFSFVFRNKPQCTHVD